MKSEFIQKFKANPFIFVGTIVILVIIVIAFVFVPAIVPEQAGNIDLVFGYYNKVPINYVSGNYFSQVQQQLMRQYQAELESSNYQIALYWIWREAFEAAVVNTGILEEMKAAGYTAPSVVVDRTVAQNPSFQENGHFSATKYRQMNQNQQMALWRQAKDGLTAEMYINDMTMLNNPSGEGSFIAAMASPQRSFDMVTFPVSLYPDTEIVSYAQANPSLFRVTHLSKITIYTNEREVRQIYTSIINGNVSFEDAAKNNSGDYYAENGGDMGSRMVYELLGEIPNEQDREKVINLGPGSISEVIKISDTSWAIFRVEEPIRQADVNDIIMKEKIRNYVLSYERGLAEDWVIGRANEFIAGTNSANFRTTAANQGYAVNSFGPLPLNYGGVEFYPSTASTGLSELSSAGSNESFWRACFNTRLNTLSEPVVIGSNIVVFHPREEVAADEEEVGFIEMYYSYYLNQSLDKDLRTYFLTNGKLDDRFYSVFQHFYN